MSNVRGWASRTLALRTSSLFRNSIYLIFGNGVGALLGFTYWALAARLYPPENVGLASAAVSAIALIASISHLGTGHGLIRFLPGMDVRDSSKTISSTFLFTGTLSLIIAAIYLAGLDIWSSKLLILRSQPWLIAGFLATALISVMTILFDNIFISRRRAALVTIRGLMFSLVKIVILLLLVRQWIEGGVLASWALSLFISLVIAGFLLRKAVPGFNFSIRIETSSIRSVLQYSVINNIATFLWSASATLLPLLVIQRLGATENAYFYIAWAIASTLALIPSSVSTSLFAEGSLQSEKLMEDTWRAIGIVLIIILPVIAVALLLAGPVLSIFGKGYASAAALFYWLALALLPLSVNQIYFGVLRVRNRLKELIVLCAVVMVVTVVGSYWFMPSYGLVAVGWAWFTAQTASALWVLTGRGRLMFGLLQGRAYFKRRQAN